MGIKATAKNGQVTQAIKTYEELTKEEKKALIIPATNQLSDYADFSVSYNKKGVLLKVSANTLSEESKSELDESIDFVDTLQVKFGTGKAKQKAKERVNEKLKNDVIAERYADTVIRVEESKTSDAQLRANKKYRQKVQTDDELKYHRNKLTTLRSARNHIKNYADIDTLTELEKLIADKKEELNED